MMPITLVINVYWLCINPVAVGVPICYTHHWTWFVDTVIISNLAILKNGVDSVMTLNLDLLTLTHVLNGKPIQPFPRKLNLTEGVAYSMFIAICFCCSYYYCCCYCYCYCIVVVIIIIIVIIIIVFTIIIITIIIIIVVIIVIIIIIYCWYHYYHHHCYYHYHHRW